MYRKQKQAQYIKDMLYMISFTIILTSIFLYSMIFQLSPNDGQIENICALNLLITVLCAIFVAASFIFWRFNKRLKSLLEELDATNNRQHNQDKLIALGSLARGMAHEINNSLQPVLGLGDLVLEELEKGDSQRHSQYMRTIIESAERSQTIISNVLEFSTQSQNKTETLNALDAAINSMHFVQSIMPNTLIFNIETHDQETLENINIEVDKNKLTQIILHIIKNASDAMNGKGNVKVEFKADHFQDEKSQSAFVISITDEGDGMDAETQRNVFTPFFSTRDERIGLGMTTVLSLIKDFDGDITFTSEKGKGSSFSFYIPTV